MASASLQLLGDGMDVTEAPLQRMGVEDRRGAGRIIGEVDSLAASVDRMGGGHSDGHALLDRDQGAGAEMLPDFGHRLQQIGSCRAQIDLGLRKARLQDKEMRILML